MNVHNYQNDADPSTSPLVQPLSEHLNDTSVPDSPGVYWGPVQSPEKALLSKLDYDALKTPARRGPALSIHVPPSPSQQGMPNAKEMDGSDTWAADASPSGLNIEYSREGTPEQDGYAFDGT